MLPLKSKSIAREYLLFLFSMSTYKDKCDRTHSAVLYPGIKLSSQRAPPLVLSLLACLTTKFEMDWCWSNLARTPGCAKQSVPSSAMALVLVLPLSSGSKASSFIVFGQNLSVY